ncbi:hypothetical protein HZU38_18875 [Mycolicibacterium vanbaalenii]|uniref:hypothetical protein n=1 Tax=Mycolicibacterium vanbaalenii TaxID=110539 RepID=UPI001F3EF9ED|nr:hypothetical protein [Mycolicibacterium vanbaalenii]UJL27007.1 hypothetical protein HZU38_18875 [Mycolicibacterium vanbaalenii]WND59130.1 hypothetical protein QQA43_12480 [Mycolicibacterium vanbaalenii]
MTTADRFQSALEKLADDTATAARRIANRRNLTKADKAVRLAGLLNRANAAAVALGDGFTARQIEALTGTPAPAAGVLPADESDRLLQAAQTALEDRDSALERVERLARSEPVDTAQTAVTDAMNSHTPPKGQHFGWTRLLNSGACEVCVRWARNGRVWPATHWMPRHPNCACVQQIVTTDTPPKPVTKRGTRR